MGSERRVLMGLVLGAHGIKGTVRVLSYAAIPEDIASYGPLEDEGGGRRFLLLARREPDDGETDQSDAVLHEVLNMKKGHLHRFTIEGRRFGDSDSG